MPIPRAHLIGVPVFVALAQQTQQAPPPPKISVEVRLVLISATVRDKHGIVSTLNRDDLCFSRRAPPAVLDDVSPGACTGDVRRVTMGLLGILCKRIT